MHTTSIPLPLAQTCIFMHIKAYSWHHRRREWWHWDSISQCWASALSRRLAVVPAAPACNNCFSGQCGGRGKGGSDLEGSGDGSNLCCWIRNPFQPGWLDMGTNSRRPFSACCNLPGVREVSQHPWDTAIGILVLLEHWALGSSGLGCRWYYSLTRNACVLPLPRKDHMKFCLSVARHSLHMEYVTHRETFQWVIPSACNLSVFLLDTAGSGMKLSVQWNYLCSERDCTIEPPCNTHHVSGTVSEDIYVVFTMHRLLLLQIVALQ